jgi:pilus assembly protein TadC
MHHQTAWKEYAMKRLSVRAISITTIVFVFLCVALLTVRYVDIPGTELDNAINMRPVIEWELKAMAR